MADLTLEESLAQPSESEKRVRELSDSVKRTSEERDNERKAREEAEAKTIELSRERDFFSSFSDIVATNPAAKDHRDEILEKVKGGYSTEDATFAVLGKAGKLNQPEPEMASPAGGSAPTILPQGGTKSVQEMTQDERRQALLDAEARGDIGIN